MFFGLTSPWIMVTLLRAVPLTQAKQSVVKVRMRNGGCLEIGLEPNGMEYVASRELRPDRIAVYGDCMNAAENLSGLGGLCHVRAPVAQFVLPQLELGRVEILHDEQHVRFVVGEDLRCTAGNDAVCNPVPGHLEAVPLHRREPVGIHLELGQCAF